jgi:peptidyl-dipeptidase Dcp
MDFHTITKTGDLDVNAFEKSSMEKAGLIPEIIPRYRSTYFNHIFPGGYSSGYYSYIWAEVLDADAFEAFLEKGNIFDPVVAGSFRKNVLERGGSEEAMKLYVDFRGKSPGIEPLLKNRGLN